MSFIDTAAATCEAALSALERSGHLMPETDRLALVELVGLVGEEILRLTDPVAATRTAILDRLSQPRYRGEWQNRRKLTKALVRAGHDMSNVGQAIHELVTEGVIEMHRNDRNKARFYRLEGN